MTFNNRDYMTNKQLLKRLEKIRDSYMDANINKLYNSEAIIKVMDAIDILMKKEGK